MSSLQKSLLKKFMNSYQSPTLREAAKLTGIQQTRFFRILNGSDMKLSEYEIIKNMVRSKESSHFSLEKKIDQCRQSLNETSFSEILGFIDRKILLSTLV